MASFVSNLFRFAGRSIYQRITPFNPLPISLEAAPESAISSPWSVNQIRTNVRNHFPRPREVKRVKLYGWKARLSTKNGKRIIMRRILRGRWYLTH